MFSSLKNHPFAVEAFFETSIVLTFALPKEDLAGIIPECLKLDIFNNKWAFLAIALVNTKQLRPKGFPEILGNDFTLVGYRIFVTYNNNAGKRLRGLYILKSETDKKKMELLGNTFTNYKYATTDIEQIHCKDELEIRSEKSDFNIKLETGNDAVELPVNSPFTSWNEARRFAGPLPFTFTYTPKTRQVLIIEGIRENWMPKPIKVIDYHIAFLNSLQFSNAVLANAFIISNIPYRWKKGKTEQWNP